MTDCIHTAKSPDLVDCSTELLAARKEVMKLNSLLAGKVLMPIEPNMTTEMKAEHIGEYSIPVQSACIYCLEDGDEECETCGGTGHLTNNHIIPWTTCKQIFAAMYKTMVEQHSQPGASSNE